MNKAKYRGAFLQPPMPFMEARLPAPLNLATVGTDPVDACKASSATQCCRCPASVPAAVVTLDVMCLHFSVTPPTPRSPNCTTSSSQGDPASLS